MSKICAVRKYPMGESPIAAFYNVNEKFILSQDERENMFTVDNKFQLNQSVYVIKKEHRIIEKKETCDICLGEGRIVYKGYKVECPKCKGKRELVLETKEMDIYFVDETPHTITSFRYSVTRQGNILKYRIDGNTFDGKNVSEDMIFATQEDAINKCDELNEQ